MIKSCRATYLGMGQAPETRSDEHPKDENRLLNDDTQSKTEVGGLAAANETWRPDEPENTWLRQCSIAHLKEPFEAAEGAGKGARGKGESRWQRREGRTEGNVPPATRSKSHDRLLWCAARFVIACR